jgi:hypothetical protein
MLAFVAPRTGSVFSERAFAAVRSVCGFVLAIQERLLNWEAQLFAGLLVIQAGTLLLARAGQEQEAEEPTPAR